jgi:uncharacterized protein YjbJ (UPF0337 family)
MGYIGKLRNRFQIAKGRGKVKVGRATGNRSLRFKGHADRLAGTAKQVGEQVKDAGKNLRGSAKK